MALPITNGMVISTCNFYAKWDKYPYGFFFLKKTGYCNRLCPSVRLCLMLSQTICRNSTKFGVRVTHMTGACNGKLFLTPPPGTLGSGQKVEYHLISITKSISKIAIPIYVCVLTNERYKLNISDGIFILSPGNVPGVGLGSCGCPGVKNISNLAMWHIKSTGMTRKTECKQTFHSRVKLVTLR